MATGQGSQSQTREVDLCFCCNYDDSNVALLEDSVFWDYHSSLVYANPVRTVTLAHSQWAQSSTPGFIMKNASSQHSTGLSNKG